MGGSCSPLRTGLFLDGHNKYFWLCIITSLMFIIQKLHSDPLKLHLYLKTPGQLQCSFDFWRWFVLTQMLMTWMFALCLAHHELWEEEQPREVLLTFLLPVSYLLLMRATPWFTTTSSAERSETVWSCSLIGRRALSGTSKPRRSYNY